MVAQSMTWSGIICERRGGLGERERSNILLFHTKAKVWQTFRNASKKKHSGGPCHVVGYYTFADAHELLPASRTFSYIKIQTRKISRNISSPPVTYEKAGNSRRNA